VASCDILPWQLAIKYKNKTSSASREVALVTESLPSTLAFRAGRQVSLDTLPTNFVNVADKGLAVCVPWVMAWAAQGRAEARPYISGVSGRGYQGLPST
jgi:hypothetical protein